jgi:hypothetical protein
VQTSNWILIFALLILIAVYLSNVAGRLDRLHLKVENARNALDRQLALRSAICSEIAGVEVFDKNLRNRLANSIQASISEESLDVHTQNEWLIESEVTKALCELFDKSFDINNYPNHKNLIQEAAGATRRVKYALTFYNDAATSALKVRKRWIVRSFKLFGRASMPVLIDFDDQIPQGLEYC